MSSFVNAMNSKSTSSVDVSEIRKEGWVLKESAMIRQYRKRWVVLTPDRLYSFKKERTYESPTEVRPSTTTSLARPNPHAIGAI